MAISWDKELSKLYPQASEKDHRDAVARFYGTHRNEYKSHSALARKMTSTLNRWAHEGGPPALFELEAECAQIRKLLRK